MVRLVLGNGPGHGNRAADARSRRNAAIPPVLPDVPTRLIVSRLQMAAVTLNLLEIAMRRTLLLGCCAAIALAQPARGDESLFARDNLVAWCIVPFDAQRRTPEQRAAMLDRLGIRQLAYDWRAEHIPTFATEIETLKRHGIKLTAFWFPTTLDNDARTILALLKQHGVRTQFWVMGGGGLTHSAAEQRQRVAAEAAQIRPIAEAAAKIGCTVELYNHGGWFGEPENQIAIIKQLKLPNVGIVYNLHHGHEHLSRFPELLKQMLPYLHALNLNGMMKNGATGRRADHPAVGPRRLRPGSAEADPRQRLPRPDRHPQSHR